VQRNVSYRQGDRSEYLAQYILSAFAISVPVPRQEDALGSDFHCSLLKREGKNLRPYLPFNIQIKSHNNEVVTKGVSFGGVTDAGNWRKHEIDQLCQTDTPFIIGIVNKEQQWIELFTTNTRYFVLANWLGIGLPREVALLPYLPTGEGHLGAGDAEDLDAKPDMPQKLWKLPIGQPIVRIYIQDSEDTEKGEGIKKILEPYLRMDQENGVRFGIGLGYFSWPLIIRTGQPLREIGSGLASPHAKALSVQNQLQVMGRSIASLLTSYRISGMKVEILQWESVLGQLPLANEPEFVKNSISQALSFARSK
jgi:hypothetical protein